MTPPPKKLLVEGDSDRIFVRSLWQRLRGGDNPPFCISSKKGIDRLLESVYVELVVRDRKALGIIIDANDKFDERWSVLSAKLKRLDIELPDKADPDGVILGDEPRVGIWLMPDNNSPGELEDFVRRLIPNCDPVWPHAQKYIDEIPEGDRKFNPNKLTCAQVNAWLAAGSRPGRMGQVVKKGELDLEAPLAKSFVNWLDRLFGRAI